MYKYKNKVKNIIRKTNNLNINVLINNNELSVFIVCKLKCILINNNNTIFSFTYIVQLVRH